MRKGYEWTLYLLLAITVSLVANWFVFSSSAQFPNIESTLNYDPAIESVSWTHQNNWVRLFDLSVFDVWSWSRPRFVSHLFMVFDVKIRSFFPMLAASLPAFSVTWLSLLLGAPLLLFRYLRHTTNLTTALVGVAFFLVSPGYISGLSMRFHPGKPLTLLLFLVLLELGRLLDSQDQKQKFKARALLFLIITTQSAGCFFDEEGLFGIVLIPLCYPRLVFRELGAAKYWLLFPPVVFFVTVTFLVPEICTYFNLQPFNFWKLVFAARTSMGSLASNLVSNAAFLIKSRLYAVNSMVGQIAAAFFLVAGIYFWNATVDESKKKPIRQFGIVLIAFVFFYTLVLSRHMGIVVSDYYYAGPVSIFAAILLALLANPPKDGKLSALRLAFIVAFTFTQLVGSRDISAGWKAGTARPIFSMVKSGNIKSLPTAVKQKLVLPFLTQK